MKKSCQCKYLKFLVTNVRIYNTPYHITEQCNIDTVNICYIIIPSHTLKHIKNMNTISSFRYNIFNIAEYRLTIYLLIVHYNLAEYIFKIVNAVNKCTVKHFKLFALFNLFQKAFMFLFC